ncbi:MAG: hypothetical protein HY286_07080 [Planctomycetes bacterium]|nr:hypothetical protein [Planctomycetota bacterium]
MNLKTILKTVNLQLCTALVCIAAAFGQAPTRSAETQPSTRPESTPTSRPESQAASLPASAPAVAIVATPSPELQIGRKERGIFGIPRVALENDSRLKLAESKRAAASLAEREILDGKILESNLLEETFTLPPYNADLQTRRIREELITLEDRWLSAHQERLDAVVVARTKEANQVAAANEEAHGPHPHPLAVPDPVRLAIVHLKRREFDRALEYLDTVKGPDARFLEGCAFDGLNRLDESVGALKRAIAESGKDARLLVAATRALKATEWRMQLGRPEDLTAALRRPGVAEMLQSALEAAGNPAIVTGPNAGPGANNKSEARK